MHKIVLSGNSWGQGGGQQGHGGLSAKNAIFLKCSLSKILVSALITCKVDSCVQLNMAVHFRSFFEIDLFSIHVYVYWASHFFQVTRKTRTCLTGHSVL